MDFIQKKEQEEKKGIEAKIDQSNLEPKKAVATTEPEKSDNILTNTLRTIVEPIASIMSKPEEVKEEVKEESKEKNVGNVEPEPVFFISNDDVENINIYGKTAYVFNNNTYYYLDSVDN